MAKKKKPALVRRSMTIPWELDAQIRKHPEVNWSAVTRDAIQIKLGELVKESSMTAMDDVVTRLKASVIEEASEDRKHGIEAGKAWARKSAEVRHLRRLDAAQQDHEYDRLFDLDCYGEQRGAISLWAIMFSPEQGEPTNDGLYEFWNDLIGASDDQQASEEYLMGFVDGAIEVWDSVKDKL